MKILTQEEFDERRLQFKSGFFDRHHKILTELSKLEIGQALLIESGDMNYRNPTAMCTTFNNWYKKNGMENRFKTKNLQHGKELILIRIQ